MCAIFIFSPAKSEKSWLLFRIIKLCCFRFNSFAIYDSLNIRHILGIKHEIRGVTGDWFLCCVLLDYISSFQELYVNMNKRGS